MEITLHNIGKQYGKHWIFRSIDTQLVAGNIYPIIGSNGSGKSTLLQVISGFITANEGSVSYTENSDQIPVEHWYQHLSMATPYLDLFEEFNISESLLLHQKLKPLSLEPQELIETIQMQDHRSKPLKEMSSGMRQRVKLALALYSDSKVLLLDEPVSNLDRKWTDWFKAALVETSKNRVVVVASNSNEDELEMANQPAISLSA